MSATCPMCSGELKEDFGLVDCPHCGSPVLISVDGSVESAQTQTPEEIPVPQPIDDFHVEPHPMPEPEVEVPVTSPSMSHLATDVTEQMQDSGLKYSIIVNGVDTAEIRQEIKETIEDMRLRLDLEAIFAQSNKGKITIEGLSSVKAALLVQRLRILPIELSWQQSGRA